MELGEYSATEALRDGRPIEIRALRPSDRHGLLGALDRMSDESIRRRFFGPKRRFSNSEIAEGVREERASREHEAGSGGDARHAPGILTLPIHFSRY